MSANNKKKDKQLGMSYGTANYRLRKALVLSRAALQLAGEDVCYQCGKKIRSLDEFSIEHMKPWLDSDNPQERFFDLNNIAFSHFVCNIRAARRTNKRTWPDGQAWCWKCKTMKSLKDFQASKLKYRSKACTACRTKIKQKQRNAT